MQPSSTIRVGIGHDTHRLVPGGPLRLGGVDIDHDHRLDGHSDADALFHAITDALLGAAGLGDIGELFPDTDATNKNRDSADFLLAALEQVHDRGWAIANLDCIIFAQQPKLASHKPRMIQRLAELLQLDPGQLGVKAKTGEHVGPVGRNEAISTQCVALLMRAS